MNYIGHIMKTFSVFCLLCMIAKSGSVVVEMESYQHEFNNEVFKNVTVTLITAGNRKVFNGSIIPAVGLNEFEIRTTLKLRQKAGRTFDLFDVTLNGCDFIAQSLDQQAINLSNFVIKDLRNVLKNFPSKCPWEKDTEVVVDNFYVDSEKWPVYVPEMPFQFVLVVKVGDVIGVGELVKIVHRNTYPLYCEIDLEYKK